MYEGGKSTQVPMQMLQGLLEFGDWQDEDEGEDDGILSFKIRGPLRTDRGLVHLLTVHAPPRYGRSAAIFGRPRVFRAGTGTPYLHEPGCQAADASVDIRIQVAAML